MPERRRIAILGAGGRDFHVFNTLYRDAVADEVVAFTAAQIPHIAGRTYPPSLAGPLYPHGIPIVPQEELESLLASRRVDHVVFAYSDVTYDFVEAIGARVRRAGASFEPFDPEATMLRASKPCVAVCAVRTGCGKSALSRHVAAELRKLGLRVAVLRHPMPYGDLAVQAVQRFATVDDLARHRCTIEEMEEYEPHVEAGDVVFAGVDYARILAAAQEEADVVVWDGGNNDAPFVRPDLFFTLLDPLRAGDELRYFPGRFNLEHADVLVIGKVDEAPAGAVERLHESARSRNPDAVVIEARSPIRLADPGAVRGRRVLVVEDGPTVTHGGMAFGAGLIAARRAGAARIVDPRPFATGEIADAFRAYPHLREVLPALGYGAREVADLAATIERADCDVVVSGTPIDLGRVVRLTKPCVRATYAYEDVVPGAVARLLAETFHPART